MTLHPNMRQIDAERLAKEQGGVLVINQKTGEAMITRRVLPGTVRVQSTERKAT